MDWLDARGGGYSEPPSQYKTAQVCINGHSTTDDVESSPELMSKFCPSCGGETITACPNCNAPIRGHFYVPGVFSNRAYHPPAYCHDCGKPLPWTAQAIETAHELTDEIDTLTDDEKTKLKSAILELTVDTPKTELASIRYKKLLAKAGPVIGSAMNKIVVTVATEAVKKMIGL
jgi:hypothetical protein